MTEAGDLPFAECSTDRSGGRVHLRVGEIVRLAMLVDGNWMAPAIQLGRSDWRLQLPEALAVLDSPDARRKDIRVLAELVAQRLSVGAGYEAVNFLLSSDPSEAPKGQDTYCTDKPVAFECMMGSR